MRIQIEHIDITDEGWKVFAVDTLTMSPLDMNVDYGDLMDFLADGWEVSSSDAGRRFGHMSQWEQRDAVKDFFIQSETVEL